MPASLHKLIIRPKPDPHCSIIPSSRKGDQLLCFLAEKRLKGQFLDRAQKVNRQD